MREEPRLQHRITVFHSWPGCLRVDIIPTASQTKQTWTRSSALPRTAIALLHRGGHHWRRAGDVKLNALSFFAVFHHFAAGKLERTAAAAPRRILGSVVSALAGISNECNVPMGSLKMHLILFVTFLCGSEQLNGKLQLRKKIIKAPQTQMKLLLESTN